MNYVVSHPKTGRTWLRFTLGRFFQKARNTKHPTNFKTIKSIFYDHDEPPRSEKYEEYEDYPKIMFAHSLPENIQREYGTKTLLIFRHVLDTLISLVYHLHGDSYKDNMKPVIADGINNLSNFYNKWVAFKDDVEIIEYSQIGDPDKIYEAIIALTGKVPLKKYILEAIEESSFDNMRKDEDKNRNLANHNRRVRAGKHHGYKDSLKEKEIESLYDNLGKKLSAEAIAWLMEYKCF